MQNMLYSHILIVLLSPVQFEIVASVRIQEKLKTTMDDRLKMVAMEAELINSLDQYANSQTKELHIVRSGVAEMRMHHRKIEVNATEYLANAVNVFALIGRLTLTWKFWLQNLGTADVQVELMRHQLSEIVKLIDLKESIQGIEKIREVFDLHPNDMANGLLRDIQFDCKWSSMDCFHFGNAVAQNGYFKSAELWFQASLLLYNKSDTTSLIGFKLNHINLGYIDTLTMQKKFDEASALLRTSLETEPLNPDLLEAEEIIDRVANGSLIIPEFSVENVGDDQNDYKKMCRGDFPPPITKLHCRFESKPSAFTILAPLKMEVLLEDPFIAIYHEVITAKVCDHLKKFANRHLKQSKIVDGKNRFNSTIRSSYSAMLQSSRNAFTRQLRQGMADMCEFVMEENEWFMVTNYGLGGHYNLHSDALGRNNLSPNKQMTIGDRRATIMIYLSDVEVGGATVFPKSRLYIQPRKGMGVIWYNLRENGQQDERAIHGSCPVIIGDKWIATKFIHEGKGRKSIPH